MPSSFGIGDLGPAAYRFADFLSETGQSIWQILPLNPPRPDHYSPYLSPSAFAGNPLLISPELLAEGGLLSKGDLELLPRIPVSRVDYPSVVARKERLLRRAYRSFTASRSHRDDYEAFCSRNSAWLDDFALFIALEDRFKKRVWSEWPEHFRDRHSDALASARADLAERISREKFIQYVFYSQWTSLKSYCNKLGIRMFGDLPIYVDYNSADVWTHPELFKLDDHKRPYAVSGVPPDYFSKTGQLWGHPLYRWDVLRDTGYDWWLKRIEHNFKLCDLVRIDHFRGFVGYWEVPASETTAINGKWIDGPGRDFFRKVLEQSASAPIIAEDLGVITPDVVEVMQEFDFPGMKVLLFAFGDNVATNPYVPHNLVTKCIAYTGTHDNNTVRGWFDQDASDGEKQALFDYLGHSVTPEELHWTLIRLLMMSVADTVVFPMQDILGLGGEDRMNTPSVMAGNWSWRMSPDAATPELRQKLLKMTEIYGRAAHRPEER